MSFYPSPENYRRNVTEASEWAMGHLVTLQAVFGAFVTDAEWPAIDPLQRDLDREGSDTDLLSELQEMPPSLGGGRAPSPAHLTVRGLRFVPEATGVLDGFMAMIRLGVGRYQGPEPEPAITDQDLLTIGLEGRDAVLVAQVVIGEGWPFDGGSGEASGHWTRKVGREFRYLTSATTIDEFLEVQATLRYGPPPAAQEELSDRVAVPADTETQRVAEAHAVVRPAGTYPALDSRVVMPTLNVSRAEAERVLGDHRSKGQALLDSTSNINQQSEYASWKDAFSRWMSLTEAGLSYVYSNDDEKTEFGQVFAHLVYFGGKTWIEDLRDDHRDLERGLNKLLSFQERLQYAAEPNAPTNTSTAEAGELVIFLVHGRDHGRRETIARFLERTGPDNLRPVILDELANKGRTLVEKLEQHVSDSKYAVVVLTGDDVGGLDKGSLQPRARQNVVLELGWFCGAIGRMNVAVLYESGVELPSDVDGLAYIPLSGEWEKLLVRELRDAGWDFQLDRLHS